MLKTNRNFLNKTKLFFVFTLCYWCFINAQISNEWTLGFNEKEHKISKKVSLDPILLTNALIKGKVSEKEKFDAIFGWVALNISYNYKEYYSSYSSIPNITSILNKRSAICLGYANLMDSLCKIARISNVTVYGYAKDEIFDVGDSIYVDNHAWNAVKLDGLWYVYDVTWSAGIKEYRLRSFSRFIAGLLDKHPEKYKQKKIKRKHYRFKSECRSEEIGDAIYYKQRFFNFWLRKILFLFKMRSRLHYVKGINTDYYLSEPKVFAITHFPDNPMWALSSDKTMRDFETDDAFYFLSDSIYIKQLRKGEECQSCDNYLLLPEINKVRNLEFNSNRFNGKNQFVATLCEYKEGNYHYMKSRETLDSLPKIKQADSSFVNFQNTLKALKASKKNVEIDYVLQENKNKKKMSLLLSENRLHSSFLKKKINTTLRETRNTRELFNRADAFPRNYRNKAKEIDNFRTDLIMNNSKVSKKKIETSLTILTKKEKILDSVYRVIEYKEAIFDTILENLSLNVWQVAFQHDSVILPFSKGIRLRAAQKDNFKKIVYDIRREIVFQETKYNTNINLLVFEPSQKCFALFKEISRSIDLKNRLEKECLSVKRNLAKDGQLSLKELKAYKEIILVGRINDYCWMETRSPKLLSSFLGYRFLYLRQRLAINVISFENKAERYRHYVVNEELQRRYKKFKGIISANTWLVKMRLNDLKQYRRSILNPKKAKKTKK